MVGTANGAMDYIAYVDETWDPKDGEDKAKMLAMEAVHLESLEAILRMAQMNKCSIVKEVEGIMTEAKDRLQRHEQRGLPQWNVGAVPLFLTTTLMNLDNLI